MSADKTKKQAEREEELLYFYRKNPHALMQYTRDGALVISSEFASEFFGNLANRDQMTWQNFLADVLTTDRRLQLDLQLAGRVFLFDITPEIQFVNLYGVDVTQQREREAHLLDIVHGLPNALFDYTLHADGRDSIIFLNSACETLWEIDESSLDGDPAALWDMIHPDDVNAVRESVQKSAETLENWFQEWRNVTHSGAHKWVQAMGNPRRLNNGDTQWSTTAVDISDRKKEVESRLRMLTKTVNALAAVLEARDPYTAGHEENVAKISGLIGRKLGLQGDQLASLELAATIHDIGKIGVPAEILSKPTRLTEIEYELIKEHSTVGANFVRDIDFHWPIAEIIEQHHERLDGSGYPAGLKGDDILLEARIIAVADTVEAIAAHRPYRAALGMEAAMQEITQGSGSLYDPRAVNACVAIFNSDEFSLPTK